MPRTTGVGAGWGMHSGRVCPLLPPHPTRSSRVPLYNTGDTWDQVACLPPSPAQLPPHPPSHLQPAHGQRVVGRVALLIVVHKRRQMRRRRRAGRVRRRGQQHARIGAVKHPLRLHVCA
eukprot:349615-Chlamydomonas_euryale.AAC.2